MPCLYGFKSIRVSPLDCKVRAPQVRFRELNFAFRLAVVLNYCSIGESYVSATATF